MADVRPFRGLRYDPRRTRDIASVISPPYDIISPGEQSLYHLLSPYNVIRLEFGEESPQDRADENKYTRASGTLRSWIEEGVLFREAVPSFYILRHTFALGGVSRTRWGLSAAIRLGDQRGEGARPHEVILESRIQDRLSLLRSCRVNVSPIMGMARHDMKGLLPLLVNAASGDPQVSATDRSGVTHEMWIASDRETLASISGWFANKTLYIADGHHRYETGLAYQREQQTSRSACTGREAFNFVLATITDTEDPGLVALPAHRLVRLAEPAWLARLRDQLESLFHVEPLPPAGTDGSERIGIWLGALRGRARHGIAMGAYGLGGGQFCLLTPREMSKLESLLPPEGSHAWKRLDVSILHWVILRKLIGLDTAQKEETSLSYTHDEREAVEMVDSGKCQLAFLMNPIPVSDVLAVADAGDRMPPKSTYFYPKLPTGLVMYPLWDESVP